VKNWIKENLVLAVGLALPLLLILLFFLATVVPKSFGTPPQYEMLFTTVKYDYQNKPEVVLSFNVKNKALMVTAKKSDDKNNANFTKLMAYDAKTETLREIAIDTSKLNNGAEVPVEEIKNVAIDTSSVSPDGYALEGPNYGGSGLVGGLFGGGYHNSGYRLKKGSVGYKVPNQQPDYYYNQLQFVGWMIKK
jgi:hypothetical protein